MYTIPNNFGEAYAHQSPKHENCWDFSYNILFLILSFLGFITILILLAIAAGFFAGLFTIPLGIEIIAVKIPFTKKYHTILKETRPDFFKRD